MSATGSRMAGFTLTEMLVVLAVLGLISGLVYPQLTRAVTAQQFRSSAAALTAGLRLARAEAVRRATPTALTVAPDGQGFRAGSTADRLLPAGLRLRSDAPVRFFADGSARGGPLTLAGPARRLRIDIAPATGLVTAH